MPCNSSTCIDRSGNLGLLLFCTLVHAIKGDVFKKKKKKKVVWDSDRDRKKMTAIGTGKKTRPDRQGQRDRDCDRWTDPRNRERGLSDRNR